MSDDEKSKGGCFDAFAGCVGIAIVLAILGMFIFLPVRCVGSIWLECGENEEKVYTKWLGYSCVPNRN